MNKLKEWIDAQGGAAEVASLIGVTPHAVRNWINRRNPPAREIILKIVFKSRGALTVQDILEGSLPLEVVKRWRSFK